MKYPRLRRGIIIGSLFRFLPLAAAAHRAGGASAAAGGAPGPPVADQLDYYQRRHSDQHEHHGERRPVFFEPFEHSSSLLLQLDYNMRVCHSQYPGPQGGYFKIYPKNLEKGA